MGDRNQKSCVCTVPIFIDPRDTVLPYPVDTYFRNNKLLHMYIKNFEDVLVTLFDS